MIVRVDASRNRHAILKVAKRLFSERGFDVPLTEIARASGVGRTTLHRNFATREDIAFALFEESVSDFRRIAEPSHGAPAAFEELLDLLLASFVRNGAIAEAMLPEKLSSPRLLAQRDEVLALMVASARRAAAAGQLRPEIDNRAILTLYLMISGAMLSGGSNAERRNRASMVRDLVLNGLRPEATPQG